MQPRVLKIHHSDNVMVALQALAGNERVAWEGHQITVPAGVPLKQKFVTRDLDTGDEVIMYGVLVGRATRPIPSGGVVTRDNVRHAAGTYDRRERAFKWQAPDVSRWQDRSFLGYKRQDGGVGTANYWLVIPLVFCENRNINVLRAAFKALGYAQPDIYERHVAELAALYREGAAASDLGQLEFSAVPAGGPPSRLFPNIDGVKFLTHDGGCGGTRQDARALCGLLAGYVNHPNVAGATVLSLGCQNAQIEIFRGEVLARNPKFDKPLYILEQQNSGSEYALMSEAIRQTFKGLIGANGLRREPAPLGKLTMGVKCGGSDGFSGISANPAVGHASDLVVALGGRAILSEFPELCGVEQDLVDRCTNPADADRFISLMRGYSAAAEACGSGFDMNPTPGNIRDGLITDAMKSAGAARKGGTSPVTDVLDYPEWSTKPGLNLLCTPGNDVESTTALAGAGANIILFTTGLGTPTGNPVAPTVKIATNSDLARRMADIIDVDTGGVITGDYSVAQAGERVLEFVIEVASGAKLTRAQQLGQNDFIPWKRGVSL